MVVFARDPAPLELLTEGRGLCCIDRLAMCFQPSAHLLQHLSLERHHRAIALRTDVQQEVTAKRNHIDQAAQFFHRFDMRLAPLLPRTIAPGLVEHGSRTLPSTLQGSLRVGIVGHHREIILIVAHTAADHTIRLQLMHQFIQLLALLWRVGTHVEPKLRDGAVAGQQLRHLLLREGMMLRRHEIAVVAGDGIGLREVPVNHGIIEPQSDAPSLASVG